MTGYIGKLCRLNDQRIFKMLTWNENLETTVTSTCLSVAYMYLDLKKWLYAEYAWHVVEKHKHFLQVLIEYWYMHMGKLMVEKPRSSCLSQSLVVSLVLTLIFNKISKCVGNVEDVVRVHWNIHVYVIDIWMEIIIVIIETSTIYLNVELTYTATYFFFS